MSAQRKTGKQQFHDHERLHWRKLPTRGRVSHGWLIALAGLLGMIVVPVSASFAMLAYDALDPMCGGGGEGAIACGMRAFVITLMSILPGLLIGVFAGQALARRRGRQVNA